MAEEKKNTIKDLDQSMIELGIKLCEDFNSGKVINDAQGKLLEHTIKLYSVVKSRDAPEKVNTGKSK